jgi:hypothetical protein
VADVQASTSLHDLPPELIAAVLSHCTLPAAIALSQVSSRLRSIAGDSLAWMEPLEAAAEAAGVHILRPRADLPRSDVDWDCLAAAGGRPIPARAFVQLLPVLSRDFLLNAELPRLKNLQWKEVCERRFLPGVLSREMERRGEDDGSLWMKGRWKSVFLSELLTAPEPGIEADQPPTELIGRLEHRDSTACAQEDHSVGIGASSRCRSLLNLLVYSADTSYFIARLASLAIACPLANTIRYESLRSSSELQMLLSQVNGQLIPLIGGRTRSVTTLPSKS